MGLFKRSAGRTGRDALRASLIARDEADLADANERIARYGGSLRDGSSDPVADRYLLREAEQDAWVARANLRDMRGH